MSNHTRYRREIAELTDILIRSGVDESRIIQLLSIAPEQFNYWKKHHPELEQALHGPTPQDQAEAALVKRALGFHLSEATAEEIVDKNTGETLEILKRRTITKDVPPDVRALLFYLKNRWPERWENSGESQFEYQVENGEENL